MLSLLYLTIGRLEQTVGFSNWCRQGAFNQSNRVFLPTVDKRSKHQLENTSTVKFESIYLGWILMFWKNSRLGRFQSLNVKCSCYHATLKVACILFESRLSDKQKKCWIFELYQQTAMFFDKLYWNLKIRNFAISFLGNVAHQSVFTLCHNIKFQLNCT